MGEGDLISTSERRKLAQVPDLSLQTMLDGEFAQGYSAFLQDQVVFRDAFRSLKSLVERRLLRKRENNGVYVVNNNLYDKFYGVNERYIHRAATLMNGIIASIDSSTIYLSVIPSKSHFWYLSAMALTASRVALSSMLADTLIVLPIE